MIAKVMHRDEQGEHIDAYLELANGISCIKFIRDIAEELYREYKWQDAFITLSEYTHEPFHEIEYLVERHAIGLEKNEFKVY